MNYTDFIESKSFNSTPCGFNITEDSISNHLFDFQKVIVKWAIKKGKAAIFADTGLGKTRMQLEWARHIRVFTNESILILAPLCVAIQTVEEGKRIGVDLEYVRKMPESVDGIYITNYEMMEHFDFDSFIGIVLDESSILKAQDSKTRQKVISACQNIPFRLSCTATPSPNDFMELGNQAEFLGIMSQSEMLAMFFTHDGGETSKWRLKGHGKTRFWEWMATWSICIKRPSDIGFDDSGYNLPKLNIVHHLIESTAHETLFALPAKGLLEQNRARKNSIESRVEKCAELINNSPGQWIVWCHLNDESQRGSDLILDGTEITGSDSIRMKEEVLKSFLSGDQRVIISKPSIFGYGLNLQSCHQMAFLSISNSWESYYQAIRRCYRFGQKEEVTVHLFFSEEEEGVLLNLEMKEEQSLTMSENMIIHMRSFMEKELSETKTEKTEYIRDIYKSQGIEIHQADCVDLAREIESDSIDYTIFSPPFSSLYTYSNSDRDMGNSKSDNEFFEHFKFLVKELYRITRPGRLLSFHCMNLQTSKQRDGVIGIKDFRGDLIRLFESEDFIYHSEVVIWKDPVTAMQRTKALGLLHKTIRKDSAMSRQGIPDYLVTMRKPGENLKPISHTHEDFPVSLWQRYASPIWMDINPSDTLNRMGARDENDERHIAPLQLEVIERAVNLWSAKDDLVFSPFMGIGSEGYVSIKNGRRFIGSELKPSYFKIAKENIEHARKLTGGLFEEILE